MAYSLHPINRLADIEPSEWDQLLTDDQPFLSHAFLSALEEHHCLGQKVGWIPNHFLLRNETGALVAAAPAYIKTNSFGEFVFDWSWASAYEQHGLSYYPKLVNAVPFTPVTGRRLLLAAGTEPSLIRDALLTGMIHFAEQHQFSSLHSLFLDPAESDAVANHPLMLTRRAYQYHWHNRGYADFEHYLSFFRSHKRKNVRRERRLVREAGITTRILYGDQIDRDLWAILFSLYQNTFLQKGNYPALTCDFFHAIGKILQRKLFTIIAEQRGEIIAAAIYFRDQHRLYGRYWGCRQDIQHLHFELCFYCGIDYCIAECLDYFEPGAQGEHKITRGFLPTETRSAHWIADERFRSAIKDFLQRESHTLNVHRQSLDRLSPFRDSE